MGPKRIIALHRVERRVAVFEVSKRDGQCPAIGQKLWEKVGWHSHIEDGDNISFPPLEAMENLFRPKA